MSEAKITLPFNEYEGLNKQIADLSQEINNRNEKFEKQRLSVYNKVAKGQFIEKYERKIREKDYEIAKLKESKDREVSQLKNRLQEYTDDKAKNMGIVKGCIDSINKQTEILHHRFCMTVKDLWNKK